MKNTKILMTVLALFIAGTSFGQLSISLAAGYHQGAFQSNTFTQVDATPSGVTATNQNYSLGGGIPIMLGLNFDVNEHVGVSLGLDYFMGATTTVAQGSNSVASPTQNSLGEAQSTQIRVSPALYLSTGNEGLDLYTKFGLVVPVSGKTVVDATYWNSNIEYMSTMENTGAFSLGYRAGLGVKLNLPGALSVFGEVEAISLNIKGEGSTMTALSQGGTDILSSQNKITTETTFVDELTQNSNNPTYNSSPDSSMPAEELAGFTSFGSWGINVGIKYTLGGND
jgi:hypothetical protein